MLYPARNTNKFFRDFFYRNEELPGWEGSCFGVKEFDQLPQNALAYIRRIEELLGVPVVIVTTGPERSETIILEHPFDCKK